MPGNWKIARDLCPCIAFCPCCLSFSCAAISAFSPPPAATPRGGGQQQHSSHFEESSGLIFSSLLVGPPSAAACHPHSLGGGAFPSIQNTTLQVPAARRRVRSKSGRCASLSLSLKSEQEVASLADLSPPPRAPLFLQTGREDGPAARQKTNPLFFWKSRLHLSKKKSRQLEFPDKNMCVLPPKTK